MSGLNGLPDVFIGAGLAFTHSDPTEVGLRMTMSPGSGCSVRYSAAPEGGGAKGASSSPGAPISLACGDLEVHLLEDVKGLGQQPPSHRNGGDLASPSAADRFVEVSERRPQFGRLGCLDQHGAHRCGALLGYPAVMDGLVAVAPPRGQARPGAELARIWEPGDVADLGDQRHRRQQSDPGKVLQRLDPGVGLGQTAYTTLEAGDGDLYRIEH